jgi:hypothetical protein
MKQFIAIFAIGFTGLVTSMSASAFLGIGDVSADPTTYGQLGAIYKQLQEQYVNLTKQLRAAEEMSNTISRAQEGYQRLRNLNLKNAFGGIDGSGVANADALSKSAALRREIEGTKGSVEGSVSDVTSQIKKIDELSRIELLQKANEKNTTASADGLNSAQAAAVSAQANASMAALAAAAAAQRKVNEVRMDQAAAREAKNAGDDFDMVRALGSKPN